MEDFYTKHYTPINSSTPTPLAGHCRLAAAAATMVGVAERAVFEISIANADKGAIDVDALAARLAQFSPEIGHDVVLTRVPLMADKAALLPDSWFVVGYDTAIRIVDTKYYLGESGLARSLASLRANGAKIVVAGRVADPKHGTGNFHTLEDIVIPDGFGNLFEAIPESMFRADISSSMIRAGHQSTL